MKKFVQHALSLLACIFLSVTTLSAQSTNLTENNSNSHEINDKLTAFVSISTDDSSINYSFVSNNVEIPEWKAPKLEQRILYTYPDVESITINPNDQLVSLSLPLHTSEVVFIKILKHFKYERYEEF